MPLLDKFYLASRNMAMYMIRTLSLLSREVSLLDTCHEQYPRFATYFLEEVVVLHAK